MRTFRSSTAVVATALALGLAACGGTPTTTEEADPPVVADEATDAASPTEASPSEEATDDGTTPAPAGDGDAVLAAAASSSADAGTARTRFTSVVSTQEGDFEVTGEGVSSGDVAQVTMRFSGMAAAAFGAEDAEMEVRLIGTTMYQRFPALTEQFGGDAEWIEFDLATLGPQFADVLEQAQQVDPTDSLALLREVADVRQSGTSEVNGVATTTYEGTLDLRAALGQSGMDPALLDGTIDLDQDVPITVDVDGDGLVRRLTQSFTVDGAESTTTYEVLEYGIDVDVQPPPADVTVSFDELMAQAGGG